MASNPKVFTAYGLPRERRRQGPAALLSAAAHVAVALAVLWRGAALFEPGAGGVGPRGGGGGGGRPAVTAWFTLPPASVSQALDVPPAPAVTVPALTLPDPVAIEVPPLEIAPPPAAVVRSGAAEGTAGGPGQGPGTGGGRGTGAGAGTGTDVGPGSGGEGGRIFPASPRWSILPPPGAPSTVRGRTHQVRFWVTVEGRVTRVEVVPPIKDAKYRREFVERMMGYLFNPATTVDGRRIEAVATVTLTF